MEELEGECNLHSSMMFRSRPSCPRYTHGRFSDRRLPRPPAEGKIVKEIMLSFDARN